MEVLDDSGRLFGMVNVVDALVVLFVVAVAVAGAALVFGGDGAAGTEPEQTNHAIVEYTLPANSMVEYGGVNATLTPVDGGDSFGVREATHSTTPDGSVHVVASVAYDGTPDVGSATAEPGSTHDMRAGRDTPAVTFLRVNRSSDALATTQRSVVLAVNESKQVAHAVSPGTQLTIGNQTVGEIVSVAANPDGPESRAELIGIDVTAYSQGDTAWFGGRAIRVNNRLTVVTDDAVVTGRIYRVGTADTAAAAEG